MSSMIFAISYFYVNNTYDDFEIQMNKFVEEYYLNKRITLKKEINTIFDILNYNTNKSNLTDEQEKAEAIKLLNNVTFEENKSNYFFHIFFCQFKIEYIEVFNNSFFTDGFRDNDNISLYQPSQYNLCNGFTIFACNGR